MIRCFFGPQSSKSIPSVIKSNLFSPLVEQSARRFFSGFTFDTLSNLRMPLQGSIPSSSVAQRKVDHIIQNCKCEVPMSSKAYIGMQLEESAGPYLKNIKELVVRKHNDDTSDDLEIRKNYKATIEIREKLLSDLSDDLEIRKNYKATIEIREKLLSDLIDTYEETSLLELRAKLTIQIAFYKRCMEIVDTSLNSEEKQLAKNQAFETLAEIHLLIHCMDRKTNVPNRLVSDIQIREKLMNARERLVKDIDDFLKALEFRERDAEKLAEEAVKVRNEKQKANQDKAFAKILEKYSSLTEDLNRYKIQRRINMFREIDSFHRGVFWDSTRPAIILTLLLPLIVTGISFLVDKLFKETLSSSGSGRGWRT